MVTNHLDLTSKKIFLRVALFFLASFVVTASSTAWAVAEENADIRGELFAQQFTTLSSEIAARIQTIPFREGETFQQGNTLITFDCAVQLAKLDRANAILKAESSKARIVGKLDELHVSSRLEIATAEAGETKAKAELAMIQAEIKRCRIVAPFAGQVVSQSVQEHQYVKAGITVLEIHNPTKLELRFNIPSDWLQRFQPGHKFLVRIHETARSYPAKITGFGARIDAVNQVVKVTSVISGLFPELKPGMSGRVTLTFGSP